MPTDLHAILRIEVPVIVLMSRHELKVDEVRSLAPGAILELPTTTDDELEVHINNQPVAMGTAVKVGENFGIRLTYVGNLKQRIRAMGGEAGGGSAGEPADTPAETGDADAAGAEDADALADEILANQ